MDGYVINEKDIESMIRRLKIHKPEKATRENAIRLSEIWHKAAKKISVEDPGFAEELEKALAQPEQEETTPGHKANTSDVSAEHILMGQLLTEELEKALAGMEKDKTGFASKNTVVINDISGGDRLMGRLCTEAQNSYEQGNYFAALIMVFVAVEQSIKRAVDMASGNFEHAIKKTQELGLLKKEEIRLARALRFLRNRILHENQQSPGVVVEGLMRFFSEDDTMQLLYEVFSLKTFSLVLELESGGAQDSASES